jgi:hypothetical protein
MKFKDTLSRETKRILRGMVVDWYARQCPAKRLRAIRKQRTQKNCRGGQAPSGGKNSG